MKPILEARLCRASNFRDRPALKYDEQKSVFVIKYSTRPEMYLYTEKEVKRILPLGLEYSNIGEPYRELVRFVFLNEEEEDYLDISPDDLQGLVNMLKSIGLDLKIPDRLCRYLDFYEDD